MERLDGMLQLVDFVIKELPQFEGRERAVEHLIRRHEEYKTINHGSDKKGITYVLRYNVDKDNETANVLDLVIRKDRRCLKFLKYIIAKAWVERPYLKQFKFVRHGKYPYRKERVYKLKELFSKTNSEVK